MFIIQILTEIIIQTFTTSICVELRNTASNSFLQIALAINNFKKTHFNEQALMPDYGRHLVTAFWLPDF